MANKGEYRIYLCGGDYTEGTRSECPNPLHDHPLPDGYIEAGEWATRRFGKGWTQKRCPECGLYGWITPPFTEIGQERHGEAFA